MVISAVGSATDTASNKENVGDTQSKDPVSNEYNGLKKSSAENTIINSSDQVGAKNNESHHTMSNAESEKSAEPNQDAGTDAVPVSSNLTSEPCSNGLPSSSEELNGATSSLPIRPTPQSSIGSHYPQSSNLAENTNQNTPNFQQPQTQPRFPSVQQPSATPTLNQLLSTPVRYPQNQGNHTTPPSQLDPSQNQSKQWNQDTPQQFSKSGPDHHQLDAKSAAPSSTPQRPQTEYYPPPDQAYPSNRYPPPSSNPISYNQPGQQYNSAAPAPGIPNYPHPSSVRHPGYSHHPGYNSPQGQYYTRHATPPHGSTTDSYLPPPDASFQQAREQIMSPNRRTPQPSAAPSPLSSVPSPHPSMVQFRGQSPSPASPAVGVAPPNATPLSPPLLRPGAPQQQTFPSRGGKEVESSGNLPNSQLAGPGFGYRPSIPQQSPYASQASSYPQPMTSHHQQQPYPSNQQYPAVSNPNQDVPLANAMATPSVAQPVPSVHSSMAQSYSATTPQPSYQQPGGYNVPRYEAPQAQHPNQAVNSPSPARPPSGQSSYPPASVELGQPPRWGAAAAAAAAMAAAAHSAQPGHAPGQRHPSSYYQQPNQQARPPHPNYNNIQQSGDAYHQQKPYPTMPPPRMPMTGPPQRRMPVPPTQTNYRGHPPSSMAPSHPGYRPTSMPPSSGYYSPNSNMAPGFQTPGGYKQTPHHEEVVKKPLARTASQKLATLFEPDEPGRREFIEAILRYWEEKDLPLKNAPLMGRKTVDLFRLYHLVKERGGMQEVTSCKKWPEICSLLGLGTTSSSGFTLKKQYCKYLYGYECKVERGIPEPQEAMARFTEANRKKKMAMETAKEEIALAPMPTHHPHSMHPSMRHGAPPHSYPPQSYPPGQFPNQMGQQYRPPPPASGQSQGYPMPRTVAPPSPNTYPPHPNQNVSTIHHTNPPPASTNLGPQPNTTPYGTWPQPPSTVVNSNYTPPAANPEIAGQVAPNGAPLNQQSHGAFSSASNFGMSSSAIPPSVPTTAAGPLVPTPSSVAVPPSSSIPIPIPTPVSNSYSPTAVPASASAYPHSQYGSYQSTRSPFPGSSPSHPYPYSNSPVPNARPPLGQPFSGAGGSPSPRPAGYQSNSPLPSRSPQPWTPQYQGAANTYSSLGHRSSPGVKRPGSEGTGPPSKMFRPDSHNQYDSMRSRYPAIRRTLGPYPESAPSPTYRALRRKEMLSHNSPSYPKRMGAAALMQRVPRPSTRWPVHSTVQTRPRMPHTIRFSSDARASLQRQFQMQRAPSPQHFKREVMYFPPNSVEATPLRIAKFQRKTCSHVGLVEGWRIIMALKSGLLVESTWALNVLNILLYDQQSVAQFRLGQLPGLLDGLVEHYRRYLAEVFTLPDEQKALEVVPVCKKLDKKQDLKTFSNSQDLTVVRQIQTQCCKKIERSNLTKLKSKFMKYKNVKIDLKKSSFLIDKSSSWDHPNTGNLLEDLSHIVLCLNENQIEKDGKEKVNTEEKKDVLHAAVEATLEDILSIPCTVLSPYVYDVMKDTIDKLEIDKTATDKNVNVEEDSKIDFKGKDSHQSDSLDGITTENSEKENGNNGKVSDTNEEAVDVKPLFNHIKDEPDLKPANDSFVELEADLSRSNSCVDHKPPTSAEGLPKDFGPLHNGLPENFNGEKKLNEEIKLESNSVATCKIEKESEVTETSEILKCKTENIKSKTQVNCKTEAPFKQEASIKEEVKVENEQLADKTESKKDSGKAVDIEDINPSLVEKVRRILKKRNVLLLEDEASGRDGGLTDPLSGPLLCSEASPSRIELSNRLRSISNILRSLSFIPANTLDISRHRTLMQSISGVLLLRHKHRLKRKRKLHFEDDSTNTKKLRTDLPETFSDPHPGSPEEDFCSSNAEDKSSSLYKRRTSGLFAPTDNHDIETQLERCSFGATVLNENDSFENAVYSDPWWWDSVRTLREDALILLCNIAGDLDLTKLADDDVPFKIVEACLHWTICKSSDACDSFSPKPSNAISAKRLSLEILTKLSTKAENIDLILAVRPFSKIEKLFAYLIRLISVRKDQELREFSIVILSNLFRFDANAARIAALQPGAISCLIVFLEECEEIASNNRQYFRQHSAITHCGTTEFMLIKAAIALYAMARITENKPTFLKYQLRLLSLSMSHLLGSRVTSIVSSVLFELTREAT